MLCLKQPTVSKKYNKLLLSGLHTCVLTLHKLCQSLWLCKMKATVKGTKKDITKYYLQFTMNKLQANR